MVGEWGTTAAGAVQARHTINSGTVGFPENLRMGSTPSPRASVTTANAEAHCDRSVGNDAQDRLATLLTTGALGAGRYDSPQEP